MQKKDFDAQNLGFSCRKKILVPKTSGSGAKKRFWYRKSRILSGKKDFHAQNAAVDERIKVGRTVI